MSSNTREDIYWDFFLRSLLASRSPSASHLLALTSCTTLIICLSIMMGKETIAMTQGMVES